MNWCPKNTALRPIVGLSDYVVEKMPIALATTGIDIDEVMALEHKVRDRSTGPLASLDCKMLEMAMLQSGLVVPDWLIRLTNELSGHRPRGILYEEIVLANPKEDMRTFTSGTIGSTERGFYYAHVLIEDALDSVLEKLRGNAATLNPDRIEGALNVAVVLTGELARMKDGHFKSFRPYLASHPVRNTKGPSGLFSPGMAELQLRSGFVPSGFIEFLHANLVYFPVQAWPKIQRALHEFNDTTVAMENNPSLTKSLSDFWQRWRKVHLATTIRQVPEITKGTGGESEPITFLKKRM